jgi:hypothetical protein
MRSCKSKKQAMAVKKSPETPTLGTPFLQQQKQQQQQQSQQQQQAQQLMSPLPAKEG